MQTRKTPLRKCVGCQAMKSKKELLRILRREDGTVCLDLTGRANGRGAYLCPDVECLRRARKSGSIARSLKTAIPEETFDALEREIDAAAEK